MPLARAQAIFRELAQFPDYRCYLVSDGPTVVAMFSR